MWWSFVHIGDSIDGNPRQTTVAYLTMPHACTFARSWDILPIRDDVEYEVPEQGESGFGFPVSHLGTPTRRSLRRFLRAIRILGLEDAIDRSR